MGAVERKAKDVDGVPERDGPSSLDTLSAPGPGVARPNPLEDGDVRATVEGDIWLVSC